MDAVKGEDRLLRKPRGLAHKNIGDEPDAALADLDKEQARAVFARRLQDAIDRKGWNQGDLAREASKFLPRGKTIGRDNISNYIRRKHIPSSLFLKALASALGVEPVDLLPTRALPKSQNVAPPIDVRDLGDGYVFLRINKRVPWGIAIKVLDMVKDEPTG